MKKTRGVLISAIIIIVILLIAFILIKNPFSENAGIKNVTIKNFEFSTSVLNVKVGTTVVWENQDSFLHDITSDAREGSEVGQLFDIDLESGMSGEYIFIEEGEYAYHCDIHPTMKAKIIVSK